MIRFATIDCPSKGLLDGTSESYAGAREMQRASYRIVQLVRRNLAGVASRLDMRVRGRREGLCSYQQSSVSQVARVSVHTGAEWDRAAQSRN